MKNWFLSILRINLILGFVLNPLSAYALDLEIGANYNLRDLRGDEMVIAGVLKSGSVVEVPDEFKRTDTNGKINVDKTLKAWVDAHTNPVTAGQYNYKDILKNPGKEQFFQVKIKKAAPGSMVPEGKENFFVALNHAQRRGHLFVLDQDTKLMTHEDSKKSATETKAACNGDCQQTMKPVSETAHIVAEIVNRIETPRAIAAMTEKHQIQPLLSDLPKQCSKFITPSGERGIWGEYLVERAIQNDLLNYKLFSEKDNLCPRYAKMNEEEKGNAFLWAMTALANEESSCSATVASQDSNYYVGRGIGLFQMEEKMSARRDRGEACTGNMRNPYDNIECSMSIMGKIVLSQDKGLLTTQSNYWGPLSLPNRYDYEKKKWYPNSAYINFKKHMKKFKACYEGA